MQYNRRLVLVTGSSGSGKSTFAERLIDAIGTNASSLSCLRFPCDAYYLSQTHLSFEERVRQNYDHPDAVEFDLLEEQLVSLINGNAIEMPVYSFVDHTRALYEEIQPADLIIAEGIFAFYDERVREFALRKIYIDTDIGICFRRRLERDIRERGRTPESVRIQWNDAVFPGYKNFIKPMIRYADSVVKSDSTIEQLVKEYILREAEIILEQIYQEQTIK